MDDRLAYRPAEVAEKLGIGRSKVYELISTKAIPSIQIGGSIRVPAVALQAWLEQRTERAPEPAGTAA